MFFSILLVATCCLAFSSPNEIASSLEQQRHEAVPASEAHQGSKLDGRAYKIIVVRDKEVENDILKFFGSIFTSFNFEGKSV